MAAGTSQAGSEALLAALSAGVKRAIINRARSCVTLYSENKPRELSSAPGWPYKSKHQLKTVPGRVAGQGTGRSCRSGLGRLEQDKPIQRYSPHPCQALSPSQDQA